MQQLSAANPPSLAVVGGGVAGLAAAVAAAEQGLRVELFESQRRLGGRAGSFRDPKLGKLVDFGQHVSLGCCTNLADFCRRTGTADCFVRQRRMHFIGPQGTRHDLAAAPFLPAPLHLGPAFARLGFLGWKDRWRIARTMGRLARLPAQAAEEQVAIGRWLREQGESTLAIKRFWSLVLSSALGEQLDRASVAASRKIFRDGFLGSRRAYELELPRVPLGEIFHRRALAWLAERNVPVHLGCRIRSLPGDSRRMRAVLLPDGSERRFDFFVVAVPWQKIGGLFPSEVLDAVPALALAGRIEAAAITSIHFWFDRPITRLPNAALVDRLGHWVFAPPAEDSTSEARASGYYYQVVISASDELVQRGSEEVIRQVSDELAAIWPAVREARLLHRRMVTQPRAVFSVRPGVDALRPPQATSIENLMLAGDWTATGWPATMEGAVRSGYLATEAVLRALGIDRPILVADLPHGRLARWLLGADARE
jgi:squalene-associated FAD-dependent desaturase